MSSKKCGNCGLVNFPTAQICKRCQSPFEIGTESNTTPVQTTGEATAQPDVPAPAQPTVSKSNLIPCPDCSRECSPTAATCPQCGHVFIQTATRPLLRANFVTIATLIICVGVFAGVFYFLTRPKTTTTITVQSDAATLSNSAATTAEVPAITPKNLTSATTALSALRRISSAVEAGVSYNDYNNRVLDAKADIDEAISAVKPQNETEREFFKEVLAAVDDHVEAKGAWNRILSDKYGHFHLHAEYNKSLLEKYGISTSHSSAECKYDWVSVTRDAVLNAIWSSAAEHTRSAAELLPAN